LDEQRVWVCIAPDAGPGRYLAVVRGDVDVAGATALTSVLSPLVDAGARWLRCEMAAVGFFGAAGARALARLAEDLESQDGWLTVERPSRSVRRVLALTGLWPLLAASA
jgi:anti-anti-sigma factor